MQQQIKIAIIGLGYVGLPLARLFATKYPVVGFNINQKRINELRNGHDGTLEIDDDVLKAVLLDKNPQITVTPSEFTELSRSVEGQQFDAVVLGVAHKEFVALDLASLQKEKSVLYDVKGVLEGNVDEKL